MSDLVATINTQIEQRVTGILAGLEANVTTAKAELEKLRSKVDGAKTNDIYTAERSRPYFAKKNDLRNEEQLRQILAMKISQESIDRELPRSSMVSIVDVAQKGRRPVRPNKPLNIALGALAGVVLGIVAGLLVGLYSVQTWRRREPPPTAATAWP